MDVLVATYLCVIVKYIEDILDPIISKFSFGGLIIILFISDTQ